MSTGLDESHLDRPQSAPRPTSQPEVQATLDQGVWGRILNPKLNNVSSGIVPARFSCYH